MRIVYHDIAAVDGHMALVAQIADTAVEVAYTKLLHSRMKNMNGMACFQPFVEAFVLAFQAVNIFRMVAGSRCKINFGLYASGKCHSGSNCNGLVMAVVGNTHFFFQLADDGAGSFYAMHTAGIKAVAPVGQVAVITGMSLYVFVEDAGR